MLAAASPGPCAILLHEFSTFLGRCCIQSPNALANTSADCCMGSLFARKKGNLEILHKGCKISPTHLKRVIRFRLPRKEKHV